MSKKKRDPLAEELQAIAQMPENLQQSAMDMLAKKQDCKIRGQILARWLFCFVIIASFACCFYFIYEKEYQLAAEFIIPAILASVTQLILALKQ